MTLLDDKTDGVNFKKVVRNMDGIWDRNDSKGSTESEIYEHDYVSLNTWRTYLKYLEILKEKFRYIKLIHKGLI